MHQCVSARFNFTSILRYTDLLKCVSYASTFGVFVVVEVMSTLRLYLKQRKFSTELIWMKCCSGCISYCIVFTSLNILMSVIISLVSSTQQASTSISTSTSGPSTSTSTSTVLGMQVPYQY